MARTYLTVFFSWIEDTETLTREEKGNLIDAMVLYARGDTEEALAAIQGNERHVWPRIRGEIDRTEGAYECKVATNRRNGARGGRPSKNHNPDGFPKNPNNPDGFSKNPNNPDGFLKTNVKDKEKEEYKEKEEDKINIKDADADNKPAHDVFADNAEADPYDPALSDDWVRVVKTYEANIGLMPNPGSASGSDLVSYYGEMGADVLICAIEATSRASPGNPARYLTAILRKWSDAGVKDIDAANAMIQEHARQTQQAQPQARAAPQKHNPALDYMQREFEEPPPDLRFIEMAREFNSRKNAQ